MNKFLFFIITFALSESHSQILSSKDLSEMIAQKMVEISLAQSQKISGHWDETQRDCAGFVRYVYKKAVGTIGPMWLDQYGKTVSYLRAQELYSFNFDYLGHDPLADNIRTGDIMVYNLPSGGEQIWHLILLLKPPRGAANRNLAIYHNGEIGKKALLKKVWAEDFLSKDLGPWSAIKENVAFLGVFRWKGWKSITNNQSWKWFKNQKVSTK